LISYEICSTEISVTVPEMELSGRKSTLLNNKEIYLVKKRECVSLLNVSKEITHKDDTVSNKTESNHLHLHQLKSHPLRTIPVTA